MRPVTPRRQRSAPTRPVLLSAGLSLAGWGPAMAGTVANWGVDGGGPDGPLVVSSLLVPQAGGTKLWLGGNFDVVGKTTGRAAWFGGNGALQAQFPKLAVTSVSAIASAGNGAWLVGGLSAKYGPNFFFDGLLTRVLASGAIDPAFHARLNGEVRAILVLANGNIVIGGGFTQVNGVARTYAAMLDPTGELLSWAPSISFTQGQAEVLALTTLEGTIYVGGGFDTVDGQTTGGLVGLDATAGTLVWSRPSPMVEVGWSLAARGKTLFAAVTNATPASQSAVEAIDVTSKATTWSVPVDSYPYALALGATTVYVGGLTELRVGTDGIGRTLLGLDRSTGAVSASFDPRPDAGVQALALQGNSLLVGGIFHAIGGQPRRNLASVGALSGVASAWDPEPGAGVYAVAAGKSLTAAGGSFLTANAVPRYLIAEVDPASGQPTDFAPSLNGTPVAMTSDGASVYMIGGFNQVNGAARPYGAAFDIATHRLTGFAPDAGTDTLNLEAIAVDASRVYVGGDFAQIGGHAFSNLAAFDKTTGAIATGYHPQPNAPVQGLLSTGSGPLYVSGLFADIGGKPRSGGAALNAAGAPLAFNPRLGGLNGNPLVRLAADPVSGDLVLFGAFSAASGRPAGNLAEVDKVSGAARAWPASTNGPVYTVSVDPAGGEIDVGGAFNGANGQLAGNEARFGQDGQLIAAAPVTNGVVNTSQIGTGGAMPLLDLAGLFSITDGQPAGSFAAVPLK